MDSRDPEEADSRDGHEEDSRDIHKEDSQDQEEEEGNQDHHREEDNQDRRMGEVEEEPLLTSEYVKRCRRIVPVNETPILCTLVTEVSESEATMQSRSPLDILHGVEEEKEN